MIKTKKKRAPRVRGCCAREAKVLRVKGRCALERRADGGGGRIMLIRGCWIVALLKDEYFLTGVCACSYRVFCLYARLDGVAGFFMRGKSYLQKADAFRRIGWFDTRW